MFDVPETPDNVFLLAGKLLTRLQACKGHRAVSIAHDPDWLGVRKTILLQKSKLEQMQ